MGKLSAIAFIITDRFGSATPRSLIRKRMRMHVCAGCDAVLLERYPGCKSRNPNALFKINSNSARPAATCSIGHVAQVSTANAK